MKRIFTTITAVAAIALAATMPARAAFPALTLIYQVPGVLDSGTAIDVGVATSVQCTNLSGVTVTLRVVAYSLQGTTVGTKTFNAGNGQTLTLSTHYTSAYGNEVDVISPGIGINAGQIRIYATRAEVFCNAAIVDAASEVPTGLPLHMVRFNAASGTVE